MNDKTKTIIRNSISLANIIAVVWLLGTGMGYLIFGKKDKISTEENRTLAKFPHFTLSSYLSGEYTEALAHYFDDNVPKRREYKDLIAKKIIPLKGIEYGSDNITIYGSAPEKSEEKQEPATEHHECLHNVPCRCVLRQERMAAHMAGTLFLRNRARRKQEKLLYQ